MKLINLSAVLVLTSSLGFISVFASTSRLPDDTDYPCVARAGHNGEGYICVCNATYCDTVNSPSKLQSGQFYHYKTSNSSAGFTKTVGKFYKHSVISVNDLVFTIDPSTEFQEIIGFGGSVTDSYARVVNMLSTSAADKLIQSYFSPSGIEYTMLRIPIGGTDFSDHPYTLDDEPFDTDFTHFKLADEDENLKIPVIKRAMSVSQRKINLLGCAWVTPAWMKVGDTPFISYISKKYQHHWAEYHIKFLQAYQKEGLDFWSLSGTNEAMLQFVFPLGQGALNSTMMLASEQRNWLKKHLKPLLVENNFTDVKFFGLEDERAFAPYWLDRFAQDKESFDALDGLALHWYSDFFVSTRMIDEMHEKYPDKTIIYTESSINAEFGADGNSVVLGSWFRAEAYLYCIMENLDHWTSAWLDWNIALDENGGPSMTLPLDAAVIVNQTTGEFFKQPMFYAMGHFSKFLPPHSRRVLVTPSIYKSQTSDEEDHAVDNLKSYLRNRLSSLADPSLKFGLPTINIPSEVRCLATSNPDGSFSVVVLNTMNSTAHVKVEDSRVGVLTVDVEEHSINTFVYWP